MKITIIQNVDDEPVKQHLYLRLPGSAVCDVCETSPVRWDNYDDNNPSSFCNSCLNMLLELGSISVLSIDTEWK